MRDDIFSNWRLIYMGKMDPAQYRKLMETLALKGTKKENQRKYKTIIQELGEREITLSDIAEHNKLPGLMEMVGDKTMTLSDLAMLQVYAKIILTGDIKAAEFLRDTVGEKPTTQVELSQQASPLTEMSKEDLVVLAEAFKDMKGEDEK